MDPNRKRDQKDALEKKRAYSIMGFLFVVQIITITTFLVLILLVLSAGR